MDQERSYIHIRPVIQEDLEVLSQLSRQTFIEAFAEANEPEPFQAYLDQAFSEETLQVELGDPSSQFFFALKGKTPIGYLKLVRDKQPSGIPLGKALEIQRIYVRESHFGSSSRKKAYGEGFGSRSITKSGYPVVGSLGTQPKGNWILRKMGL